MDRVATASAIMSAFVERTGIASDAPPRRYLWTDAFAVCNLLALHRETGAAVWADQARALIRQVHRVLGRHRPDDVRHGWISGLGEVDGERHPTAGGLRIGKPLPERRSTDPIDDRIDWDRDGQYYHYLTRWMHALARAADALGEAELLRNAAELARAAHAAFAHDVPGGKRLYWKMTIDLARPAVDSAGQHDALDGLAATATLVARRRTEPDLQLEVELRELAWLCHGRGWATTDALSLGMLLTNALLLARTAAVVPDSDELIARVLRDGARSLDLLTLGGFLRAPARERLAFRELGLGLGLAAAERLAGLRARGALPGGGAASAALDRLLQHVALRPRIESFWLEPAHQAVDGWLEHEDINAVMLATSLLPDGYLA